MLGPWTQRLLGQLGGVAWAEQAAAVARGLHCHAEMQVRVGTPAQGHPGLIPIP